MTHPKFRVVGNRLALAEHEHIPEGETPLQRARRRFGRPFAHQRGTDWKPRETPLLTEWMQRGGSKQQ